jgi:cell division protein FtsW (lipid II flippase)
VQIAAEQGLVGLIAYISLFWVSMLRAYRLRTHAGILRFASIGVCATAAAVAGHECFEYLQVNYLPVHLAAVLGLAGVLPRLVDVEDRL